MAGLINQLSGPAFAAFLDALHALSARPTLEQIQSVMVAHGVQSPTAKGGMPSLMAAKTVREGPYARYLEKIESGKQMREALVNAANDGHHPLDAIEEAMVIELQDHLTEAEEGVDVKFVIGQVMKLRASISMRKDSDRKQADLERKLRESVKKIEVADSQLKMRDEQIAKLERDRAEWERKRIEMQEAVKRAQTRGGMDAETLETLERKLRMVR